MSVPNKEETAEPEPAVTEAIEATQQETVAPTTTEPEAKESKAAPPTGAEPEAGEEEIEVVEEKIYTIPVSRLGYTTDRGHRAPRAVRDVKNYVSRHMKADEVAISNEINATLWASGINKPPRKITVRAVKDKEGKVVVYPAKT